MSKDTIQNDDNVFMRGIFYYAGLERGEWAKTFAQNDHTSKQLEDASEALNAVLKRDWRQGRELEFKLQHRGNSKINLVINDPKVRRRYVRISRRSSGFTHFFGLKTMLHAYEREARAASYIWLFDEPGISLHPDGQHDLLQALDTISKQNQVVYTTHSLFMIDKNYPARHRLLAKADEGTRVDGKPFLGNWRAAIDALGLALPGTILFATHVLLVEGASDSIFLNAILQWMAEEDLHTIDINPLSIMPVGDPKEADAVVRILMESSIQPRLAALYDGDQGGTDRKDKLKKLLGEKAHVTLAKDKTIEDYIPGFEDVFVPVVAAYASRTFSVNKEDTQDAILKALKEETEGKKKRIDVVLEVTQKLAKLDDEPSKVGIARDYAHALLEGEHKIGKSDREKLKKLVADLQAALELPTRTTNQDQILQS
ncbi:AAA family ATPase [Parvibaculum sp.]|uniref:ATP-dependent nuclease n=1 Tax=Parvibaculum sp. TaxID=2024848 RepID=UPI001B07B7EC|nr:AAA family ATPase [Parvibaculum sp.]MBO6669024.1 AAA family ATPase [Parvibaculum sp.]MBO6691805.1 AAA family ATPase [Parvibaculum sp.]MBO6715840.1 AAA family ATPase [Parvibaculum sp.]